MVTKEKKEPENIVVVFEYCKARMAVPNNEAPPTCCICGERMLKVEND